MGLAASQARMIALEARMSDVEYEGQQINQARLDLTVKTSQLNKKLYDMTVPTPPLKSAYKIMDSFVGAGLFKDINFEMSSDGKYDVYKWVDGNKFQTKESFKLPTISTKSEDSWVPEGQPLTEDIVLEGGINNKYYDSKGKLIQPEKRKTYQPKAVYKDDVAALTIYGDGGPSQDQAQYYETEPTTKFVIRANTQLYKKQPGEEKATGNAYGAYNDLKDNPAYKESIEKAKEILDASDVKINEDNLAVILTKSGENGYVVRFTTNEALNSAKAGDGTVNTVYEAGVGKIKQYLAKGVSPSGMTPTGVPIKFDIEGVGEVKVSSSEASIDEDTYEKEYAQYLADKILYDDEQNEINAQLEDIHNQDKRLDLQLQDLDTQRNALKTEMDALKKIIQDATESGFKTFSG